MSATSPCSTPLCVSEESTQETSKDFRQRSENGAKSSNLRKLTYEDIFYRRFKESRKEGRKEGRRHGDLYGFPQRYKGQWCNSMLKVQNQERIIRIPDSKRELVYNLPQANHTDFRSLSDKGNGANASSSFLTAPGMRGEK